MRGACFYSLIPARGGNTGSVILAGRFLARHNGCHIAILCKVDGYDLPLLRMEDLDDNVRFLRLSFKVGARLDSAADQAAAAKGIARIFAVALQILQHLGGHSPAGAARLCLIVRVFLYRVQCAVCDAAHIFVGHAVYGNGKSAGIAFVVKAFRVQGVTFGQRSLRSRPHIPRFGDDRLLFCFGHIPCQRRNQQGRQNCQDHQHHDQFYQRESPFIFSVHNYLFHYKLPPLASIVSLYHAALSLGVRVPVG